MTGVRVIATLLPVWTLDGGRRVPIGSRVPVELVSRTRPELEKDTSLRVLAADEPTPEPPVWTERECATRAEVASHRARLNELIAKGYVPSGHPDLRRLADWLDVVLASDDPTCLHLAGLTDLRRFVGEFEHHHADPLKAAMRKTGELAEGWRAAKREASALEARLSETTLPSTRESEVATARGDIDAAMRARLREEAIMERRAALRSRIDAAEQRAAETLRQIETQPYTTADALVAKHLGLEPTALGARRCVSLGADGTARLADGTAISLHGRPMRDEDAALELGRALLNL